MDQYYKSAVDTERASKVPEVTLGFWIIKVLATTLGETGGDAVTMSMNLGYLRERRSLRRSSPPVSPHR
jgi:uncharacterized membrane-anchored protein